MYVLHYQSHWHSIVFCDNYVVLHIFTSTQQGISQLIDNVDNALTNIIIKINLPICDDITTLVRQTSDRQTSSK